MKVERPITMLTGAGQAIVRPNHFFTRSVLERAATPPLFYGLVSMFAVFVQAAYDGLTWGEFDIPLSLLEAMRQFVFAFPKLYLLAAFHHLAAALVLPGRGQFSSSVAVVAYASAPALLTWIPLFQLPVLAWIFILSGLGFARLRNISILRGLLVPLLALGVPLSLILGIRTFVVEAFQIPSAGMYPTLLVKDHVFVSKSPHAFTATAPAYGAPVVFEFPDSSPGTPPQDFLQRTVALPGDSVEFRLGRLILNGWEVPICELGELESSRFAVEFLGAEPYLTRHRLDVEPENWGPFVVPVDEVFVVGDNRTDSHDSRYWNAGAGRGVPLSAIEGGVTAIWFPTERIASLSSPHLPAELTPLSKTLQLCLSKRPRTTTPPNARKQ